MAKEKYYGFDKKYTEKDVCEEYKKGKSLSQIYKDIGVAQVTTKKILNKHNIQERQFQVEYKEVIIELEKVNIGKKEIYDFYIVQGKSQKSLKDMIFEKTSIKVGDKVISSLLKYFEIKKTPEQIKRAQGSKSLSEKAYSYSMLKKAGFNSTKELADFYTNNSNMTYSEICELLNNKIGKDVFTPRWLGRHMAKEIAEENKVKSSVSERSLMKYVDSIYSGEILKNNYNIIPPKELDIYIPEFNIAIEFNGLYWHSDKFIVANHDMTSYDYHYQKWELCKDKGIQLLFVWEDDWEEDKETIKKAFVDALSLDNRIFNPKLFRLE